ncbi:MAG TPA: NAD(P)/FAD-dependent oxidoreductase, partial [Acidobacteriaceae bacterium]|nr:NAD(P)/FAD-dependent oxidoreductase [Acidobacteriaceae bacterium]
LMCAIEAGKHGKRVAVLEHAEKIGKKILISGGGRCNFTNLWCSPENFISANPHFCKSALARYTPQDFIALVSKYQIPYHEKTLGQLFCDGSAREIVALLEAECREAGVQIYLNAHVERVSRSNGFEIHTPDAIFSSGALVVATGGLSIPKMGATPFGYQLATQFGIAIQPCRPALVPLLFSTDDQADYVDLAGVAATVLVRCGAGQFHESLLLTHRGLSGPAILQISSYWKPGDAVEIDLAPDTEWTQPWRDPNLPRNLTTAKQLLRAVLPHRLADRWLALHPPQDWTNRSLSAWERELHHWTIVPAGTEGYAKAEVTAGGIDTRELSAKTMECRNVPGLFFIGEVVDVTGHLGGFNFQWAWASGFCAGQALSI